MASGRGAKTMDVRRLLKVYNYVNDDRRPKVNLKFAVALVAFLLSGFALIGFFSLERNGSNPAGPANAARQHTEYVGLDTSEIAQAQADPNLAYERLDAWKAAHPDARIERQERVEATVAGESVLLGWQITWEEP